MMMMDISIELAHPNSHHQFQSHYSTNFHYEEPPYLYGATATETGDTPPSPQDVSYYHPQQIQENPIINTDSGLSYTNLDYANTNGSSVYHQNNYTETYPRPHLEVLLHEDGPDNPQMHNYVHDNKYHHHSIEIGDGSYHHSQLVSPTTAASACMDYQHLHRYKEEVMQGGEGHSRFQQHHVMHGLNHVPQHQPVLPTYKWMQVKRNVPKPSEVEIHQSIIITVPGKTWNITKSRTIGEIGKDDVTFRKSSVII
ncbi:hypothetical protein NQ317_004635 [Molorchus minor]|uniref:Uncharacterized protein n=1 Tax=Molorchus minor TaxID=1323400 RepID=A0ABQ9IYN0_9CUCU|nr:hypothetical protein NQ317_004635 [Molorchus minor]